MRLSVLFGRLWIVTTMTVVAAAAACVRLGFWQIGRLSERRAFNTRVDSVRALPALSLPSSEELGLQEYRTVVARGSYDLDHQIALRNQVHEGQYGYHLLTPLVLEDTTTSGSQTVVLVDRGWIPAAGNDRPEAWRQYDVHGPLEIRGVIRTGQERSGLSGLAPGVALSASQESDFVLFVDPELIGRQLPYPLVPIYVQLEGGGDSVSVPLAAPPQIDLGDGPHLGYALQWFAFAAALLIGYPFYVKRRQTWPK